MNNPGIIQIAASLITSGFSRNSPMRKQQVADVAHPEQVPELVDSPVVHALRQEEDQREYAEQTEFCAGRKIHAV